MSTMLTFDTLEFVKKLKAAGFPEKQAEAISGAFKAAHAEMNYVTKHDLDLAKSELSADIQQIKAEMKQAEQRMTIKLGTIMVLGIGVVATLVKIL